jgi:acetoin utilization deacetylase AcuC-like enzyme
LSPGAGGVTLRDMTAPRVVHSYSYAIDIGPHVFPTAKYAMVRHRLVGEGWVEDAAVHDPEPAPRALLELAHAPQYLDDLDQLRMTPRTAFSELPLGAGIVNAYRRACAGTLAAARGALEFRAAVHVGGGFHHASRERAEGFCYLNDLAVAIRGLMGEGRIARAAVVDLDVHQGNGTASIFEGDASVFTLSIHQEANYPEPKARSTLDVGLDDGVGDEAYDSVLAEALEPVWRFGPELVLYVAGVDPYLDDQLGGLALTMDGLARRDARVLEGCASRGIPVAVTFGGGYARRLEDTVAAHAATCRLALRISGAEPRTS